ncbi:TetR/AcrR family transcriptional regulator [Fervidibacillus halotolerans]|uniref:TetR/AcrR family transcriptional regulator n=1 Tax=Fervidibacillus halotolerans TaxID=2980027 RepID=A0A9E8LZP2_9BACI|nr:TetR/AcrR family transcriptional regulator [Fervidibacillus halotolerans]WAA12672.1 TetR/AcrR family transcriptional regulator [Fervidibacillus halotolerans]
MLKDTRTRILKSAAKLFAQNGYEGVRTKQIAEASNISEVTLFKYFPQKEILYHTLLDEFYQTLDLSPLVKKLSYTNIYEDCLQIANAVANNLVENIDIILMRQKEKVDFLKERKFNILKDPSYQAIVPVFQTYYDNNEISVSPEKAANIFLTSITGAFHLLAGGNFEKKYFLEYVEEFVNIFCRGIQ